MESSLTEWNLRQNLVVHHLVHHTNQTPGHQASLCYLPRSQFPVYLNTFPLMPCASDFKTSLRCGTLSKLPENLNILCPLGVLNQYN